MLRHAAALASILLFGPGAQAEREDAFLEGYATAVLVRDLGLEGARVDVERGVATVELQELEGVPPQQVAEALARIDGIERVEVVVAGGASGPAAEAEAPHGEAGLEEAESIEFLPRRRLFEPLLADPRQPHFSASYLGYLDDPELRNVGSATFGGSFAFVGGPIGGDQARWELGMLAGVYSIFDLNSPSYDLVNSDFIVGPTLSFRRDWLSSQLRLYHQSSHLGDEFLLRNRVQRVNLSYEGIDLLVSADPHPALRAYLGAGAIFHDEPALDPFSVQVGLEIESPVAFLDDLVRPIAAGDFQFRQQNDWEEEISVVAGISLENPEISWLRFQILGEYFRGNSPNGQFFERRIEYLGVGAHLHF